MVAKGSPENRIRLNLKALHRTALVAVFLSHFLRALGFCLAKHGNDEAYIRRHGSSQGSGFARFFTREFPGHQSPVSNGDLFTSKKWIGWFRWDDNGFITGKVNPC